MKTEEYEDIIEAFDPGPSQNNPELEEELAVESPALEAPKIPNPLDVKVETPDLQKFLRQLEKIEVDINLTMQRANSIKLKIEPAAKNCDFIQENVDKIINQNGERPTIDRLIRSVSKLAAAFYASEGYLESIKDAQERIQMKIDDMKKEIGGE